MGKRRIGIRWCWIDAIRYHETTCDQLWWWHLSPDSGPLLELPLCRPGIDYAIVTASNNKNYLVLAGSREAAFFAIDQLMQ